MDALLVTTTVLKTTSFLTRAQAFQTAFMNWFLRSLNMLPVYRVRDGISEIQKNNEIFQTCVEYLTNGEAILVFAEANHDLRRRLRPLSKGFTRIVFDAEVQNEWGLDLYVQPVGVNYSDHRDSRNEVRLVFADPIRVSDFKSTFEEDERKAANDLKNKTAEHLKSSIMHVPKLDQYPLVQVVLDELEADRAKLSNPDYMNSLVDCLEKKHNEELIEKADKVLEIANEFKIKVRIIAGVKLPVLKRILFAPLYFLVWLNNIIPYLPVEKMIKTKIKDPAFDVSIKFVLGLVLFPIFYGIVALILLALGVPTLWIAGYLIFSIMSSVMFKSAQEVIKRFKEKRRLIELKKEHPDKFKLAEEYLSDLSRFRADIIQGE